LVIILDRIVRARYHYNRVYIEKMNGNNPSTPPFCTMGGMDSGASLHDNGSMQMHRRKLGEHDDMMDMHNMDMQNMDMHHMDMPVILPDDGSTHDMHGMDNDHNHNAMDHNTMDHSQSDNSMSMGSGTIMYMDGFHSALFPSSSQAPPPCLNLLHPSWVLHTRTKFVFAMVFVTVMGVLVEACGVWRVKCLRKGRKVRQAARAKRRRQLEEEQLLQLQQQYSNDATPPPSATSAASSSAHSKYCPSIVRRTWRKLPKPIRAFCTTLFCGGGKVKNEGKKYEFAGATLHAGRATLGYFLMLAVMSYAIEFLFCAVIGMVLGRFWFVERGAAAASSGIGSSEDIGIGNNGLNGGESRRSILNRRNELSRSFSSLNGGIGGTGVADDAESTAGGDGFNDAMWGGGGDPCCGIDDGDESSESSEDSMQEPLISLRERDGNGVTRRSGAGYVKIGDNLS